MTRRAERHAWHAFREIMARRRPIMIPIIPPAIAERFHACGMIEGVDFLVSEPVLSLPPFPGASREPAGPSTSTGEAATPT